MAKRNSDFSKKDDLKKVQQQLKQENQTDVKPRNVKFTMDIPEDVHKKLKEFTKRRGYSIKGLFLFLADKYMKESKD